MPQSRVVESAALRVAASPVTNDLVAGKGVSRPICRSALEERRTKSRQFLPENDADSNFPSPGLPARFRTGGCGLSIQMCVFWYSTIPRTPLAHITYVGFEDMECRVARRAEALRISIVAFTALDEIEVRCRANDRGSDGYCQKGHGPSHPG
jgi:hypothetical protein